MVLKKFIGFRASEDQRNKIKEICQNNGNCSESKVVREALNLVTTGNSSIFESKSADFPNNERKTIQFADDKKILADCPHCQSKIRLDPEHYKKFKKIVQVLPSFIPAFNCKDDNCVEIHSNENYSSRPTALCSKCYQFAKKIKPQCAWCQNYSSIVPISETQLDQMGIPKPYS